MSPEAWALFLASALVAEVIGTMAGFGAATILTPVATLFMDVKTAIAVVACFHFFGNASRLVFFGRHLRWAIWARFGLIGIACSLAGASVAAHLPSAAVKLALGVFLVLYVASAAVRPHGWRLPPRPSTLIGGGAVSGLIAGLIGTGGAIRSACLLAFGLPKDAYIGTSAAIALAVDATRLPVYLIGGFVPGRLAIVLVTLVIVAFAGAWIGQRLVRRIAPGVFEGFVRLMLLLMGMKLAVDGWAALARASGWSAP